MKRIDSAGSDRRSGGAVRQGDRWLLGAALGVIALFAAPLAAPVASAADSYEVKVSHAANTKHPLHKMLERFERLAEERSDGRLDITIFHSGQLAGQREGVEGLQLGTIEIVAIPNGVAAAFDPAFMLLDIPFQFENLEHARRVMDGAGKDLILSGLGEAGLVGLELWEQGYRNLGTSNRPVGSVADVKDLKLRTMEAPLHVAAWRALGANPTPMGWASVFSSLQQGVIEGVEIPSYLFTQTGVHEVVDHVILTHHIYDPVVMLASKRWFDGLPADLQKIVVETMRELTPEQRELNQADVVEAERQLPGLGVEVTELSQERLGEFARAAQGPVIEEVRRAVGDAKVDDWLAAVEGAKQ